MATQHTYTQDVYHDTAYGLSTKASLVKLSVQFTQLNASERGVRYAYNVLPRDQPDVLLSTESFTVDYPEYVASSGLLGYMASSPPERKGIHTFSIEKTQHPTVDIDIDRAWQSVLAQNLEPIRNGTTLIALYGPHYARVSPQTELIGTFDKSQTRVMIKDEYVPIFFPIFDIQGSSLKPDLYNTTNTSSRKNDQCKEIGDAIIGYLKTDLLNCIYDTLSYPANTLYEFFANVAYKRTLKQYIFAPIHVQKLYAFQLFTTSTYLIDKSTVIVRDYMELQKCLSYINDNNPLPSFRADAQLSTALLCDLVNTIYPSFLWEIVYETDTDWRKRVILRMAVELVLEPEGHGRQYAIDPNNLYHRIRFKFSPTKGPLILKSDLAHKEIGRARMLSPIDHISEFILAPTSPIFVVRRSMLVAVDRTVMEVPELALLDSHVSDTILSQIARVSTPYTQREARIIPIITQRTKERDQLTQIRILKQLISEQYPSAKKFKRA